MKKSQDVADAINPTKDEAEHIFGRCKPGGAGALVPTPSDAHPSHDAIPHT